MVSSFVSLPASSFTDYLSFLSETTKGPLVLDIYRDWSPLGADRFMELIHDNFYTNIALFRCVEHFLTQFGISDVPEKKVTTIYY